MSGNGGVDDLECELVRNVSMQTTGYVPPSLRPVGAAAQYVQFIIEMIVLSGFVLCFIFFKYAHPQRHTFYRLHVRSLFSVVVVHLGVAACGVTGNYFWSQELATGVPCYVQILSSSLIVPLLLAPCLVRMINYYQAHELTQMLIKVVPHKDSKKLAAALVAGAGTAARGGGRGDNDDLDDVENESVAQSTFSQTHARGWQRWWWWFGCCCCGGRGGRDENTEEKLLRLRFQTSQTSLQILLVIALTPYLVAGVLFVGLQQGVHCYGCRGSFGTKMVILVGAAVALMFIALFIYLVRGKQDGFGVLREIRQSLMWGGIPAVTLYALEITVGVRGNFSFYMLLEPFLMLFVYFQSVHQCVLAWIESKQTAEAQLRYQMSIAEFEKLVVHPLGVYHAAFCKRLEIEHSLESMSFLNAMDVYERGFFDVSVRTNTTRVKKILNMYVGDNAVLPCNLSSKVTENLLSAGTQPTIDMFREAKEELCTMLYRDAFTRFIITSEFKELFEKLNQAVYVPQAPTVAYSASSVVATATLSKTSFAGQQAVSMIPAMRFPS